MRGKILVCVITCLAVLSCVALVHAQPLTGYEKILVIRLGYDNGVYQENAQYIRYGQAPNLNILSGNKKAVISDSEGKTITSFVVMEPGIATGDSVGTTVGGSPYPEAYLERSRTDEIVMTIPYLPDMQVFRLYDEQGTAPLISVDLTPSHTVFCADYPNDPDCLKLNPQSRSSAADTNIPSFYLSIFAFLVLIAAMTPFIFKRMKTAPEIPLKKSVLIVDDEPDLVELVRLLLEKQGYHSMSAPGGKECLDILRQKKNLPDVILLDIMMQPMDGWETLEKIKSNPDTKDIPVLMLTGKQLTAAEAKQYHICIEDYIMKPLDKNQLFAAIEHVLTRKKVIHENIVLAKKAGVAQETFCEYAKLSRHVDINKKLIGLLEKSYGTPEPGKHGIGDALDIIEQMIMNTRSNEDRLEQLQREIFSAFTAKGYPVPIW
jgi:two-component system OmpR family response regulator